MVSFGFCFSPNTGEVSAGFPSDGSRSLRVCRLPRKGRKNRKYFWQWPRPMQPNRQGKWNPGRCGFPALEAPSFVAGDQTGKADAAGSNWLAPPMGRAEVNLVNGTWWFLLVIEPPDVRSALGWQQFGYIFNFSFRSRNLSSSELNRVHRLGA